MRFIAVLALLVAFRAQAFPVSGKPPRIVVPFPPGGQTDLGARDVQKAAPDGHTLLYSIAIHLQLPHLHRTPPWDAFRDFTPVTTGARSATVLTAHASTVRPPT